jgi:hypothetical protein
MNYQQAGFNLRKMNEMISKVPMMIGRLSNGTEETLNADPEKMKTETLFTKVNLRPNPFSTVVTLEVTSGQNKQVIVRMTSEEGQIFKLFSWYLLKGTNVTTITELTPLHAGGYILDILDNNGALLYSVDLKKA